MYKPLEIAKNFPGLVRRIFSSSPRETVQPHAAKLSPYAHNMSYTGPMIPGGSREIDEAFASYAERNNLGIAESIPQGSSRGRYGWEYSLHSAESNEEVGHIQVLGNGLTLPIGMIFASGRGLELEYLYKEPLLPERKSGDYPYFFYSR